MEDSLLPSPVGSYKEFSWLKLLLEMEEAKNLKMEKELEEAKRKVVQMRRRSHDVTQVHLQEKRTRMRGEEGEEGG